MSTESNKDKKYTFKKEKRYGNVNNDYIIYLSLSLYHYDEYDDNYTDTNGTANRNHICLQIFGL